MGRKNALSNEEKKAIIELRSQGLTLARVVEELQARGFPRRVKSTIHTIWQRHEEEHGRGTPVDDDDDDDDDDKDSEADEDDDEEVMPQQTTHRTKHRVSPEEITCPECGAGVGKGWQGRTAKASLKRACRRNGCRSVMDSEDESDEDEASEPPDEAKPGQLVFLGGDNCLKLKTGDGAPDATTREWNAIFGDGQGPDQLPAINGAITRGVYLPTTRETSDWFNLKEYIGLQAKKVPAHPDYGSLGPAIEALRMQPRGVVISDWTEKPSSRVAASGTTADRTYSDVIKHCSDLIKDIADVTGSGAAAAAAAASFPPVPVPVYLLGLPASITKPSPAVGLLNAAIREAASKHPHVTFIDLSFPHIKAEHLTPDGPPYRLTRAGNEKVLQLVAQAVKARDGAHGATRASTSGHATPGAAAAATSGAGSSTGHQEPEEHKRSDRLSTRRQFVQQLRVQRQETNDEMEALVNANERLGEPQTEEEVVELGKQAELATRRYKDARRKRDEWTQRDAVIANKRAKLFNLAEAESRAVAAAERMERLEEADQANEEEWTRLHDWMKRTDMA